jgi:hypothetical protein
MIYMYINERTGDRNSILSFYTIDVLNLSSVSVAFLKIDVLHFEMFRKLLHRVELWNIILKIYTFIIFEV